jgi:hypothetical protein
MPTIRLSAGGDAARQATAKMKSEEYMEWLWTAEVQRRRAAVFLFAAANIAVSAAIPSSAYNPLVWLSTIIGRMFTTILMITMLFIRAKDVSRWYSSVISLR